MAKDKLYTVWYYNPSNSTWVIYARDKSDSQARSLSGSLISQGFSATYWENGLDPNMELKKHTKIGR